MKRMLLMSIAICMSLTAASGRLAHADTWLPIDLRVPKAPTPVAAHGKSLLVYEVHLTNLSNHDIELQRLEVLSDGGGAPTLGSYADDALVKMLHRPGLAPDAPNKRTVGAGLSAVIYLVVTVDKPADVPRGIRHRLHFKLSGPEIPGVGNLLEGAPVTVLSDLPVTIGAPLRGERWLAANAISNVSGHRRALISVNGRPFIGQRFAIDWLQLGPDGKFTKGDAAKLTNWYGYGAEVLAVADGVVSAIKDGIPENVPLTPKREVPITLETIAGNHVIVDIGKSRFAFFAHFQPGSLRVKVGDKVRKGQILGLLGNSGNTDAPHLHLHIMDANSPLAAEGLPFVFESFDEQGELASFEAVLGATAWKPATPTPVLRRREVPVEDAVIRFR